MSACAEVSRAVWENPIVRRELYGFGHRLRDWRLWIGLRLPREPREWGLPAITWFALAPYIQWVLLLALSRFSPSLSQYATPDTVFAIFLLGLGLYACAVATVIGATTVTREREQATWEQVAVTPMTTWELVSGYWLSRAVPIGLGVIVSLLTWVLLYPHYLTLLERLGSFNVGQADLAQFGFLLLVRVLAFDALGLMFSTLCRSSAAAATLALGAVAVVLWTDILTGVTDRGIAMPHPLATVAAYTALGGTALVVAAVRVHRLRAGAMAPRATKGKG